jgi:hypothetical protein
MKLFKTVDEKLSDIGFIKDEESKFCVNYKKNIEKYGYVQILEIQHKASGIHTIHSYEEDVNKDGYNNSVGLSLYATKLALKKAKKMGLKPVKK